MHKKKQSAEEAARFNAAVAALNAKPAQPVNANIEMQDKSVRAVPSQQEALEAEHQLLGT